MALQANKIILKEATKMSLHERFSVYRQQTQATAVNVRQKLQQHQQASARNQRLAQQMANRPSVIAALKLKKKSLKQRLGGGLGNGNSVGARATGVKSRLSLGTRQSIQNRLGQIGRFNRGGSVLAMRGGVRRAGRGTLRSGTSPMLKARLGNQATAGFNRNFQTGNRRGQNRSGRGAFRRGRGFTRGFGRQQRGGRGQSRPNNTGGRGRGGRRGGGADRIMPSKQELDNQLDEYMAQTKNHLDAQLDAYMAEAE